MTNDGSEAYASSLIRLGAHDAGYKLFRNNVGVLKNEDGRPVRYGLANESAAVNKQLKSGDFIGWRRRLITLTDVGSTIAQIASIEAKREGWVYNPNDPYEAAQARWAKLVNDAGGIAFFSTGGFL